MDPNEDQQPRRNHMALSRILASEFNLEIELRERMTQTLNARIAWAVLLKESLETGTEMHVASPDSFRYAAFDSLKASEKPSEILLEREAYVPPNLRLQEALRYARPAPKAKVQLPRNSKSAFLYIRSSGLLGMGWNYDSVSDLYVLKCPVCLRIAFTSLQGLLNHARISHALEWGTHEECIRACVVADPHIDVDAGIEVGVSSGGILPGIRTIFENAVGPSHSDSRVSARPAVEEGSVYKSVSDVPVFSHLTKTLGLHENSPALAPFLGKVPTRRCIKVYQEDQLLDIDSLSEDIPRHSIRSKNHWRPQLTQRSIAYDTQNEEGELAMQSSPENDGHTSGIGGSHFGNTDNRLSQPGLGAAMTRFHFTTRIVVTDRSLWLGPGQNGQYTHKWMLTLHSPSYVRNITTVLRSMKVTPLLPGGVVRCHQQEVDRLPYAAVGVASQPFLARIDLVFNDAEGRDFEEQEGQSFTMDHWVDLDPLKSPIAVVGEEQICDIELDKRTIIRPADIEHSPTNFKALWKLADESLVIKQEDEHQTDGTPRLAYEQILSNLLPRFPLTLPDSRRRRGLDLPYKLVTPSQFSSLAEGRQKAIEWGRTRALRNAYNEIAKQRETASPFLLSAANVHAWLREEGHLHLNCQVGSQVAEMTTTRVEEQFPWCSLCGLERTLHPLVSAKQVKGEEAPLQNETAAMAIDVTCSFTPQTVATLRPQPIDVEHLRSPTLCWDPAQKPIPHIATSDKALVRLADPHLTLAIQRLIRPLDLSSFEIQSTCIPPFPSKYFVQTPERIEAVLAPYSLMAVCLRPFIKKIVCSGLDVAKQQRSLHSRKCVKKGGRHRESDISLLTPAHILTGIRMGGREAFPERDSVGEAILLCLSNLGTVFAPLRNDALEKPAVAKTEEA